MSRVPAIVLVRPAQARVDARTARLVYMAVIASSYETGRPLPGLPLANVLFNAADQGLDQAFDSALAILAGFRLGSITLPGARTPEFADAIPDYLRAFQAEFRRIDRGYRAGGSEQETMHAYVMAGRDPNLETVWRAAFATAEKPSGWERLVNEAADRDRQGQPPAKQSGARA